MVNRVFGNLPDNAALADFADVAKNWDDAFSPTHHRARRAGRLRGAVRRAARADDRKQAEWTLDAASEKIAELAAEFPGRSIGVLVRRNQTVRQLIHRLRSRHHVAASEEGGNPLVDSPAVAIVLSALLLADHPGDRVARFHLAHSPLGPVLGVSDHDDDRQAHAAMARLRRRLLDDGYGRTLWGWAQTLAAQCDEHDLRRLEQLVALGYSFGRRAGVRPSQFVTLVRQTKVEDPSEPTGPRDDDPPGQGFAIRHRRAAGARPAVEEPPARVGRGPAAADRPDRAGLPPRERIGPGAAAGRLSEDLRNLAARGGQRIALFAVCRHDPGGARPVHGGRSQSGDQSGEQAADIPQNFRRHSSLGPGRGAAVRAESIAYEHGQPAWGQQAAMSAGGRSIGSDVAAGDATGTPAAGTEAMGPIAIRLRTSGKLRHWERRSPSELEGGTRVRLADVLRGPAGFAAGRCGTPGWSKSSGSMTGRPTRSDCARPRVGWRWDWMWSKSWRPSGKPSKAERSANCSAARRTTIRNRSGCRPRWQSNCAPVRGGWRSIANGGFAVRRSGCAGQRLARPAGHVAIARRTGVGRRRDRFQDRSGRCGPARRARGVLPAASARLSPSGGAALRVDARAGRQPAGLFRAGCGPPGELERASIGVARRAILTRCASEGIAPAGPCCALGWWGELGVALDYNVGSPAEACPFPQLEPAMPRRHVCRFETSGSRFVLSARAALLLGAVFAGWGAANEKLSAATFRPPAVPLVTIDPYTSCWSMADRLYDEWPKHWTGRTHAMCGLIRVDGKPLRFMGTCAEVPAAIEQQSVVVRATRSIYNFRGAGVDLTVTFTSPLLLDDLDLLSRPASYVTFSVESDDGKPHQVQLYFDATAEWAVNTPDQLVEWHRPMVEDLAVMRVGTENQPVLVAKGDDRRIDWGWLLVAAAAETAKRRSLPTRWPGRHSPTPAARSSGTTTEMPRAAGDHWPVLSVVMDLGSVGSEPVERHLTVGYDDVYSIEYFGRKLRPGGGATKR